MNTFLFLDFQNGAAKFRTVRPAAGAESPPPRRLPLVELLIDTEAELFELAVWSGLQVLDAMLDDDEELDIPMARGQVLFPDAQIEYVTAAGAGRRCNVEVASEHYGGGCSPLGHENPQTTQVYYEPSRPQVERAFREAMGRKAGDGIVAWQTCENTGCAAPEPASR